MLEDDIKINCIPLIIDIGKDIFRKVIAGGNLAVILKTYKD